MSSPVIIGSFGKSFGVNGWIKVHSFTDPQNNILNFRPWLVQVSGCWQNIYLEDSQENIKSIVVKLPGCDSPEAVNNFTNAKIGVWRKQLPQLPENEYYWTDLIGLKVVNLQQVELGVVQELMATGANDVLVVVGKQRQLIPYISHVVIRVDLEQKIMHVDWENAL